MTTPAPTPTPTPPPSGVVLEPTFASAVLTQLNQERAANGLGALTVSSVLTTCSSYNHDIAMSRANTMSHQLPGEADLGTRISACGYSWTRAAENIGWTTDESSNGALSLETMMINEVAPNDGHRQNILSPNLREIGISVIVDNTNHKLWLTEDFGTP